MAKNNRFVSDRFDEVRKFGCDVATYFPEVQYGEIGIRWARPSWFSGLLDEIKASVRAKEDPNKENKSLQKSIQTKDRKLVDQEAELLRSRELRGMREEKLSKENLKLESDFSDIKQKLDKSLKRPDEVRTEFSGKLQRLHDKVRNLEGAFKEEKQNNEILKLDNTASLEELGKCQTKVTNTERPSKRTRRLTSSSKTKKSVFE
jgi:DNA gyrase/topoisomerase IV subunit A